MKFIINILVTRFKGVRAMIYKKRNRPKVLSIMDALLLRAELSEDEKQYTHYQIKGFEGELVFDKIAERYLHDKLVLNDLLLKVQGSTFQIDSLVITNQTLVIYEVKNYEGEFLYQDDKLTYYSSGTELLNPVSQVQRSTILLKQFLRKHNITIDCQSFVVFINPDCTVYQRTPNRKIILPSQLKSHFSKFYNKGIITSQQQITIAELLCNNHQESYPFIDIPKYQFNSLNKGVYCGQCKESIATLAGRMCFCKKCGFKERASQNAIRHILEYQMLFPDGTCHTAQLFEWCNGVHSMYRLRSVLKTLNLKDKNEVQISDSEQTPMKRF